MPSNQPITTDDLKVERVAKAIFVADGTDSSWRWEIGQWEASSDDHSRYRALARAAIEELTRTGPKQTTNDYSDAETAIGILLACGQDLDVIENAIPPSKRNGRFSRALESLRARVAVGEEMRGARRHGQP